MGRRIKVRALDCGGRIRIAATAYVLPSDEPDLKEHIRRSRKEAARWLYFCRMKDKLNDLISMNFRGDDWSIVLSVDDEWLSGDFEQLRAEWRRCLERLKYQRKKKGRPPVSYLYVIEGFHGDKRPHIHILMKRTEDAAADIEELNSCWRYGLPLMDEFQNVQWYDDPAKYLTKEPNKFVPRKLDRNCYVGSRNLSRPREMEPFFVDRLDEVPIPEGFEIVKDNTTRHRCGAGMRGQIVAVSRFLMLEATTSPSIL